MAAGREHNDLTKHVVPDAEHLRTAVRFRPPPPTARMTAPERGRLFSELRARIDSAGIRRLLGHYGHAGCLDRGMLRDRSSRRLEGVPALPKLSRLEGRARRSRGQRS